MRARARLAVLTAGDASSEVEEQPAKPQDKKEKRRSRDDWGINPGGGK